MHNSRWHKNVRKLLSQTARDAELSLHYEKDTDKIIRDYERLLLGYIGIWRRSGQLAPDNLAEAWAFVCSNCNGELIDAVSRYTLSTLVERD